MVSPSADLTRTIFQLLALATLIAGTFWILKPFLAALTWAIAIVVASWPILLQVQSWLGGRRRLAVMIMTMVLLLSLLLPLSIAVLTILRDGDKIVDSARVVVSMPIPNPPAWLEHLPLVGDLIARTWRETIAAGPDDLATRLAPYLQTVVSWFLAQVGGVGMVLLQFLLTVVMAALLYSHQEEAARGVERFANRIAGARGKNAVQLAAQATRAVALGVVVTAIVQSTIAGIGLAIVGVPFAAFLTAIMFMLGVAQVGPLPILLPAVIWVYYSYSTPWFVMILVWSILSGLLDNVLRPMLIKRGADLPLILIFAGVIGGLIAFGIIGLFIGPVVLAVAYTLFVDWVSDGDAVEA